MFGNSAFRFSIGAKINECFASIYHDQVKDGPMRGKPRPAPSTIGSKTGFISKPNWNSIINKLN